MKNSVTIKIFITGILCLGLLIPIGLVALIVDERESRYREVQDEISRGWGDPQRITGPACAFRHACPERVLAFCGAFGDAKRAFLPVRQDDEGDAFFGLA